MLLGKERAGSTQSQPPHGYPKSSGHDPAGFVLADLDDRNLLFSEADQAIYELSDLAASVWRSLDEGLNAVEVVRELMAAGLHSYQAEHAVKATMLERRKLSAVPSASAPALTPTLARDPSERLVRVGITLAGLEIQVHVSKSLIADVAAVFGHLAADLSEADLLLCLTKTQDQVILSSPGQEDQSCPGNEFIPLLKAQLIESVLRWANYEVALHAAALSQGSGAVLLVGGPGSGKTTLAIALAKAGFKVLADDVVLLGGDGLVTGLPLPFAAKSSSWPLLSSHWPGITDFPSHRRADGRTLCYIPHHLSNDAGPERIGAVVILNRQGGRVLASSNWTKFVRLPPWSRRARPATTV